MGEILLFTRNQRIKTIGMEEFIDIAVDECTSHIVHKVGSYCAHMGRSRLQSEKVLHTLLINIITQICFLTKFGGMKPDQVADYLFAYVKSSIELNT